MILSNGHSFTHVCFSIKLISIYCGLQNNRPKDDEKIPEDLFRGRKDAEKTVERSFCARKSRRKIFLPGLSGEKSVFLPFEKIFRGLFPTDKGTLIPGEYSKIFRRV